jgi:DNA-binding transcriptional regulator YiaG
MSAEALRAELARLRLSQAGFARFLEVDERTVRRWSAGAAPIPRAVELLLPRLSPAEVDPARAEKAREGPQAS